MAQRKSSYVLESKIEADRLDRQSRMKGFDFRDELQHLPIKDGQKILDAGCGSGIVSNYLAKRAAGVRVVGVDFSKDRVIEANARYGMAKNIRFAQKNLLELEPDFGAGFFGDGRFDVIVCRFVLRHVDEAKGRQIMKNFFNALKPGGTIYCVDIESMLEDVYPSSDFLKRSLYKLREDKAVNFQVARKMPAMMLEQGFDNVDWHPLISSFKGEEQVQEIDNLEQAILNAESWVKRVVGGTANFTRFRKEYFTALRTRPGLVLYYNRVIAHGKKPSAKPKLVKK